MDGLKATYIVKERSCASCRFGPIDGSGRGKCEHFAHWDISHEPLSGRTSLRIPVMTAEARSEAGLCGPEGLLFEPYGWWRGALRQISREPLWIYIFCFVAVFAVIFAAVGAYAIAHHWGLL